MNRQKSGDEKTERAGEREPERQGEEEKKQKSSRRYVRVHVVSKPFFTLIVRTFDATFLPRSDLHKFTSNTSLKAAWKKRNKKGGNKTKKKINYETRKKQKRKAKSEQQYSAMNHGRKKKNEKINRSTREPSC